MKGGGVLPACRSRVEPAHSAAATLVTAREQLCSNGAVELGSVGRAIHLVYVRDVPLLSGTPGAGIGWPLIRRAG